MLHSKDMLKFTTIKNFLKKTEGATAIEYGLLAAGIALSIVVVVFNFGDTLYALLWEDIPNAFDQ